MTQSRRQEGVGGNRRVPPKELAGAQQPRQRVESLWGKQGFPHTTEPQAREQA